MPLHLLSKKSWNVYSPVNIERVKRDEAKARRQATEQEKRSLKQEAGDRLSTLQQQSKNQSKSLKRKLPGEDDTDRDIRLALEISPASTNKEKQDYGSLVDANGHISLIPVPEKRSCVDQEEAKDPYTVYLTDAIGKRDRSKDTWYTSIQPERQKWGDDNPQKQERELARLNANDPLAAMKRGVKALRENERQRQEWMRERERDLEEVVEMDMRNQKLMSIIGIERTNIVLGITIGTIIIIDIDDGIEITKLSKITRTLTKGMDTMEETIPTEPRAEKPTKPDGVKTFQCRVNTRLLLPKSYRQVCVPNA
ncbi:uncharacterized protein A1O5_13299 [Cladophialophora psammophila CBS 110553]|uniref:CBF1-interacting co-repressor CIR N-terminal domain-containing protein n=1 Tax=Cladophialophora psammophila CBS 110553 TaxID=1182543 RepID=W9VMT2_9EURO|nr:uncharacterized protein A1O5_13299 [Cladophialophora psammophila CBS 110553]EXJ53431.1 hypothetical protein A1O5_13299 [Cladophialophora psammophila CBS 110553]